MSFFGSMLAGAAGGLGQGMIDQNKMDEQARLRKEAEDARLAQALQIQQMRNDSKTDHDATLLAMKEMNGGGSGKGGSGPSFIEKMIMEAKTPEEQQLAIRTVQMRMGNDAAGNVAEFYGQRLQETIPSKFDPDDGEKIEAMKARGEELPTTVTRDVAFDREKGRVALNRLMAMADPAKYDDYTKGEARAVGTDAVTGAKTDGDMRKAGALNMALEGKDRFGEAGGTVYDKALGGKGETTDVGRSQINENNAQAGESGAKGGKAAKTEKLTTQWNTVLAGKKQLVEQYGLKKAQVLPLYKQYEQDEAEISKALRDLRTTPDSATPGKTAPAATETWVRDKNGKLVKAGK